jgi:hypothetical protein
MRVASWDPSVFDDYIKIVYEGLLDASYIIKDDAVRKLRSQIGLGKTTGISRPVYKRGKYAGKFWTARQFGNLIKSIRVSEKYGEQKNVRVYAGSKMAFYGPIFEYDKPYLRPAFYKTVNKLASICQEKVNRGIKPGVGYQKARVGKG